MTALMIIGIILLIVIILLLTPLRVKILYIDELKIYLYYGFIRIDLTKDKKPKPKVKKTNSKSKPKKQDKKIGMFEDLKNKHGIIGAVNYIKDVYIIPLFEEVHKLTRRVVISPLYLNIVLGDENKDASELAIEYGKLCPIIYTMLGLIASKINIKKQKVNISVDYTAKQNDFRCLAVICTKPLFITTSGIRALFKIITKNAVHSAPQERKVYQNER